MTSKSTAQSLGDEIKLKNINNLINHIVLPPKLPQSEDDQPSTIEQNLLRLVQNAASSMAGAHARTWRTISAMLLKLDTIRQKSGLDRDVLDRELSRLEMNGNVSLHLKAHNSGLIIWRKDADTVVFESFEISAPSEVTMTTSGPLLRTFPGRAVACPSEVFFSEAFRSELSTFLRKLYAEPVLPASRVRAKDNSQCFWDSADPRFVTDCLMTMLSAIGTNENVSTTQKRIRDDIVTRKGLKPWHRTPFWLFLRVSILRVLQSNLDAQEAQKEYKHFMIQVLARLLESAIEIGATPNFIAILNAKLAQRVHKFEQRFGDTSVPRVYEASQNAHKVLSAMWDKHIQTPSAIPMIPTDSWEDATLFSSEISCDILWKVSQPLKISENVLPFAPPPQLRILQDGKDLPSLADRKFGEFEIIIILADVEQWVEDNLASWTTTALQSKNSKACCDLANLVRDYWSLASKEYHSNPQETSLAILTILELWAAIDKICATTIRNFAQYPPEIPPSALESLLLPKSGQMHRLADVERYLRNRVGSVGLKVSSAFAKPTETSFAVRFYKSSSKLQNIRRKIKDKECGERSKKIQELNDLTCEYDMLMRKASRKTHSVLFNERGERVHNDKSCAKCELQTNAENIRIEIFEEFLPDDHLQKQAAIFELAIPLEYAAWRDATWLIIHDIGGCKSISGEPMEIALKDYKPLSKFNEISRYRRRVILGSSTKPFLDMDNTERHFPTNEKNVCIKNGLKFDVWDKQEKCWTSGATQSISFKPHCTFKLPESRYSGLAWASDTFKHTANEALSRQDERDNNIDIHEFSAFCTLRSGERIQWLNILRELGCNNLSQNEPAVVTLLLQTIWEAGTLTDHDFREAHSQLREPQFCRKLLSLLQGRLDTVQNNWQEQQTMTTIIQLCLRVLSLAPGDAIQDQSLEMLRNIRTITLQWCRKLRIHGREHLAQPDTQAKAADAFLNSAILCFSTFDVHKTYLPHVLASAEDFADAAEAQTLIFESAPVDTEALPSLMQQELSRYRKIAVKIESHMYELLEKDDAGLHQAICRLWHDVRLGGNWEKLPGTSWVSNQTVPIAGGRVQSIHYSIVGGDLLVDGKPLGNLPANIKSHPLYQQVFRSIAPHFVASDMPGMEYQVSQHIEGQKVHIGLDQDELLIVAVIGDQTLQVLSPDIFAQALPAHFVENCIPWLHRLTQTVEFRPRDSPWKQSEENWIMEFPSSDLSTARAQMRRKTTKLIDNHSPPGQVITGILSVLDFPPYCQITMDKTRPDELRIHLPRYNLHFLATKQGELESLEFHAIVDTNQCIGTLVGLRDKLVLLDKLSLDCPNTRRVLIPYGALQIEPASNHVKVGVEREDGTKQRYFVYRLDEHLEKLRHESDTLSQLYKAYLHAITSFSLPDPFTGCTGTEEAFRTLNEASLYSPTPLSPQETSLLNRIAALTPIRKYPKMRMWAQLVSWDERLPSFAQHDDFYLAAEAIHKAHSVAEILYDSDAIRSLACKSRRDPFLTKRARSLNKLVMRSGVHVPLTNQEEEEDHVYQARDQFRSCKPARNVHQIADLIRNWPPRVSVVENLTDTLKRMNHVGGYHESFVTVDFQDLVHLKLNENWGSLYEVCRTSNRDSSYKLMFIFCPMAFGAINSQIVNIRTLLAFAFSSKFSALNPPQGCRSYELNNGISLSKEMVLKVITSHARLPSVTKAASADKRAQQEQRKLQCETERTRLLAHIMEQSSRGAICLPHDRYDQIGSQIQNITTTCQAMLNHGRENVDFLNHIEMVNEELQIMQEAFCGKEMPIASLSQLSERHQCYEPPDLVALLKDDRKVKDLETSQLPRPIFLHTSFMNPDTSKLRKLIDSMPLKGDKAFKEYKTALKASCEKLEDQRVYSELKELPTGMDSDRIKEHFETVRKHAKSTETAIREILKPSSKAEHLLMATGLWPRSSRICLLQSLSRTRINGLSTLWKSKLLELAEAIALWQRSERLFKSSQMGDLRSVCKEIGYVGHDGWRTHEYPSWLLLEIENNITIRRIQAEVALEMINPASGTNSILQLNMGEGKSSVILPMIATVLADGERLLRVIVLKALLRQSQLVLTQRLGGLLDQRVSHIPISRNTKINDSTLECFERLLKDSKENCGLLLTLPEEVLSTKLLTREFIARQNKFAPRMLELQSWFATYSRDVLDESDEVLKDHNQLIYPVGSQHAFDGNYERWVKAQAVLDLLHHQSRKLADMFPEQINLNLNGKNFPTIEISSDEVFDRLKDSMVEGILAGKLEGVRFDFYSDEAKSAIKAFIGAFEVSQENLDIVNRECKAGQNWTVILILRGLLAYGVVQFVIQRKRWLVEYGLHPTRCLMAVPYRAKGIPSTNAEFGHPDVGILLTCLSYYYTGLRHAQIEDCFRLLAKDSNSRDIYANWISTCQEFPKELTHFDSVNLDDLALCQTQLFPNLQFNIGIITYYLNQVVFPREATEFIQRISASGWDIPSESKDPRLLTTGFSGTNDIKSVLPFSIKQHDLERTQHTNAHVLNLVLQDKKTTCIPAGSNLGIFDLLTLLSTQSPRINVLIDVGAQVLEATNLEIARQWLHHDTNAVAIVFFDDFDEATIMDRGGTITPLRISPLSYQLDKCLFYLDEAHTRGIDLAIPGDARAAVTLGPRLSKDRLMQACMRLRRLGEGQSVCFIVPLKVYHDIRQMRDLSRRDLEPGDVLVWSIMQTCQSLDNARSLRLVHGIEYLRQQKILESFYPSYGYHVSEDAVDENEHAELFWEAIKENVTRQLKDLYDVHQNRADVIESLLDRNSNDPMMKDLALEFDSMTIRATESNSLDIEQERQVIQEIENQRQIQKPPRPQALNPEISQGLEQFINTGLYQDLIQCHNVRALKFFQKTSGEECFKEQMINPQVCRVHATKDFAYVVHLTEGSRLDHYLRPVNWVLSSDSTPSLLVVSPYEVNQLLPMIKASSKVRLHVYAPRLQKIMASFHSMDFYIANIATAQSWSCSTAMAQELGLAAGSLYLENEESYGMLCDFLGLVSRERQAAGMIIDRDGYVSVEIRERLGWSDCPFQKNPLPFFRQIFNMRMHGKGIAHTHMGAILDGRALEEGVFEDQNQPYEDEMDTRPG